MVVKTQDLTEQTIVVTGATSGIGLATAWGLAEHGAHVIMAGRSAAGLAAVVEAIRADVRRAHVTPVVADLASLAAVRGLGAAVREIVGAGALDALINNAGTVSSWHQVTPDGYELQFAVNHLAPFLLTHELMPLLKRAPAARVVTVSSGSHRRTRIRWRDVMFRRGYRVLAAYKQSKLANVLFTAGFNRFVGPRTGVRALAADPGLVNTPIGLKGTSGLARAVWARRSQNGASPDEAAQGIVFLATDPAVDGSDALYWKDGQPLRPSRAARKPEHAERLWSLSERLCGVQWS